MPNCHGSPSGGSSGQRTRSSRCAGRPARPRPRASETVGWRSYGPDHPIKQTEAGTRAVGTQSFVAMRPQPPADDETSAIGNCRRRGQRPGGCGTRPRSGLQRQLRCAASAPASTGRAPPKWKMTGHSSFDASSRRSGIPEPVIRDHDVGARPHAHLIRQTAARNTPALPLGMARRCSVTPKISCSTTSPGPRPPSGSVTTAGMLPPSCVPTVIPPRIVTRTDRRALQRPRAASPRAGRARCWRSSWRSGGGMIPRLGPRCAASGPRWTAGARGGQAVAAPD